MVINSRRQRRPFLITSMVRRSELTRTGHVDGVFRQYAMVPLFPSGATHHDSSFPLALLEYFAGAFLPLVDRVSDMLSAAR